MAITLNQPNTIHLSGYAEEVGDLAAGVAIYPGMLVERYNPSGTIIRCRPHATASVQTPQMFAVEQSEVNKNVTGPLGDDLAHHVALADAELAPHERHGIHLQGVKEDRLFGLRDSKLVHRSLL